MYLFFPPMMCAVCNISFLAHSKTRSEKQTLKSVAALATRIPPPPEESEEALENLQ